MTTYKYTNTAGSSIFVLKIKINNDFEDFRVSKDKEPYKQLVDLCMFVVTASTASTAQFPMYLEMNIDTLENMLELFKEAQIIWIKEGVYMVEED